MRLVIMVAVVLSAAIATAVVPPPNDDCGNAKMVGPLPYVDVIDTTFARPALGDAAYLGCGDGNGPTVWYEFIPPADGDYCARTCGSDYDTVMSAVNGSCFGQEIECSDDGCYLGSFVSIEGIAGVPVLFVIGKFGPNPWPSAGGGLVFSVHDLAAERLHFGIESRAIRRA